MVENYAWWQILVAGLMLIGLFVTLKGIYQYYLYGNVKLVLESNSITFKFFCLTGSNKKFNLSKEFKFADVSRIYTVKKASRFMYYNYFYEIEGKSKISKFFKEPIEVFPALFEATEKDRNSLLHFIKSIRPDIEIGFRSIYEKVVK